MLRLYDYLPSGNGYKVRLLLHQLGIPFERVEMDILRGETRTPEFLAKNPNGRIPTLELEDGSHLAESNAILCYLADGTPFLPADRLERARVLQWMCFEQYSHEPNIATVRFWYHSELTDERRALLPAKRELGEAALRVMDGHLRTRRFFVGDALHRRGHRALRVHARGRRGRLRSRAAPRPFATGSSGCARSPGTSRSRAADDRG